MSPNGKEPMTPARWQRVKEIVADALDHSPSERAAFVATACADDDSLAREVESLLKHSEEKTNLDAFAADLSWTRADEKDARVGQLVGDYRILHPIGRGGMGAVYLAERADREFEKKVAIKILKRGTDTDEVLRRFRRERQILAQLAHPNIAHLLDAGTTEDGLPYFAMEYVQGTPITEFCDARNLGVSARLEFFLKVCAAVQFAHRNLIVHRDIKPGNIFVTEEGEPKLLDFGIAKLLTPEAADIQLTMQDRQRLTPGYASPEQVRGEAVTTASDVYSLGALLYELLTAQTPHRFSSPHPTETEMLRVISEGELPAASSAAQKPDMRRELRGDLDNILASALRKEPERRYSGVAAFAEDLRRFLEGRTVRAHKDTFGYRTSKFVLRNRLAVAAAALVFLALVVGLGVAAWQAQVAAEQAKVARAERGKAEQRFNQVRELARAVLFDYHDAIATLPGSTVVRQRLVQDALRYLDNLSNEAGEDRSLLREVADAYEKVAAVQGGFVTSAGGATLSAANLGDAHGALASQRKALAMREKLASTTPPDPKDVYALAATHAAIASFTWAVGTVQETAAHFRRSVALLESLLAKEPANEDFQAALGFSYNGLGRVLGTPSLPNLGDPAGGLVYARKSVAVFEKLAADHPANLTHQQSLVTAYNAIGGIYQGLGDTTEQLAAYRKALEVNKAVVAADPENIFNRRELAVQLGNFGSGLVQLKDRAGALPYFREALAIFEGLVAADPNDFGVRRALSVAYRNVAVCVGTNDPAEALTNFGKATETLVELVGKDPKNIDFRRQWAFTYLAKSRFQNEADDLPAAVESAREGIKIEEAVVADAPGDASAQTTLALLQRQLGSAHAKWAAKPDEPAATQREHWNKAKEHFAESRAVYESLRANGKLGGADTAKPDELAAEIAKCDAALIAANSGAPRR